MRELTTPAGARLRYRDEGSGDDALLLIHGWCSSGRAWERTAGAFARRVRVVRVDLRGHGASRAPDGADARARIVPAQRVTAPRITTAILGGAAARAMRCQGLDR